MAFNLFISITYQRSLGKNEPHPLMYSRLLYVTSWQQTTIELRLFLEDELKNRALCKMLTICLISVYMKEMGTPPGFGHDLLHISPG